MLAEQPVMITTPDKYEPKKSSYGLKRFMHKTALLRIKSYRVINLPGRHNYSDSVSTWKHNLNIYAAKKQAEKQGEAGNEMNGS